MQTVRRITMWTAPVFLLALAALSIYGAFLGAEGAGQFFSSTPVLIFWCALLLSFGLAIVFFPGMRGRPGLLAMHVGPILVILGTMYGSQASHQLRNDMGWRAGPESGYLVVREGRSSNTLRDKKLDEKTGTLPFQVKLRDFKLERYAPDSDKWELYYVSRGSGGMAAHGMKAGEAGTDQKSGGSSQDRQVAIDWQEGKTSPVPDSGIQVEVLEYIPHAEPVFENQADPVLEVVRENKENTTLPARKGEELELEEPPVTLRIVRVFSNLQVEGMGQNRRVVDAEGSGNPALKVEVKEKGKDPRHTFIMPRFPMHGQAVEGISLRYSFPEPTGARPAGGDKPPAMKIRASTDRDTLTDWIMVEEGREYGRLSLAPLSGSSADRARTRALYLARPGSPPKSYKSDVLVLEEGQQVGQKTIEVNDPLHYGGYHLYQSSYDRENQAYTVLLARSDDGLWLVYAGFLLLCGGVVWFCWGKPVKNFFADVRKEGDSPSQAA